MPSQTPIQKPDEAEGTHHDGDLSDLLQELRILLPGAQVLTAFLIILPFSTGFAKIQRTEQWVYVATFACSVVSLALFTAPAAQHRLERPLRDRERFKRDATRLIILGLIPLSVAVVLATQLVVNEAIGRDVGFVVAAIVGSVIALTWWLLPLNHRRSE